MWLRRISVIVVLISCLPAPVLAADKSDKKPLPAFDDVKAEVATHFKQIKDYRPDDILTVGDVAPLFPKLEKLGWKVDDQKKILQLFLPDNDEMVKQLRTRKGRPFMAHIAKMKLGYDRFDRLRQMPYGQFRVRELIDDPKGWEMIEYMTSTPNGKTLGKQLSKAIDGEDFNKPTGKLYSEIALIERLQKSYDAEAARQSKAAQPASK